MRKLLEDVVIPSALVACLLALLVLLVVCMIGMFKEAQRNFRVDSTDATLRSCLAHPALVQHCAALDASDDAKLQALKDALDAAKAEKE